LIVEHVLYTLDLLKVVCGLGYLTMGSDYGEDVGETNGFVCNLGPNSSCDITCVTGKW